MCEPVVAQLPSSAPKMIFPVSLMTLPLRVGPLGGDLRPRGALRHRTANRFAVLVEERCGPDGFGKVAVELNCGAHGLASPFERAFDRRDDSEMRDLRVFDDGIDRIDGRERHVVLAEAIDPV